MLLHMCANFAGFCARTATMPSAPQACAPRQRHSWCRAVGILAGLTDTPPPPPVEWGKKGKNSSSRFPKVERAAQLTTRYDTANVLYHYTQHYYIIYNYMHALVYTI